LTARILQALSVLPWTPSYKRAYLPAAKSAFGSWRRRTTSADISINVTEPAFSLRGGWAPRSSLDKRAVASKGGTMVSIWWLVGAFLMGGFAGLLAFSLVGIAGREGDHAVRAERTIESNGLRPVRLDKHWTAQHHWHANLS